MKANWLTTAATAALLAIPVQSFAQASGSSDNSSTLQQPTPPAAQDTWRRADTPGLPAVPNNDVEYSQAMERLFQAAQRLREAVQAMAAQPAGGERNQAMTDAREALRETQQAMTDLPMRLRTGVPYEQARQHLAETQQLLLQDQQTDPQRAKAAADRFAEQAGRMRSSQATAASGSSSMGPSGSNSATGANTPIPGASSGGGVPSAPLNGMGGSAGGAMPGSGSSSGAIR